MSNPVLKEKFADKFLRADNELEAMSVSGTALKSLFLLAALALTSFYTFNLAIKGMDKAAMLSTVGLIGGFIVAMVITFSKNIKLTAPLSILYSLLEGLAIGAISGWYSLAYGNSIVVNAIVASFAALFTVLFLYSARIIKCTEKFTGVLMASMLAILIIYLVSMVISFINPSANSLLFGSGAIGIGFSIFVCVIASLNFIMDFHFIEQARDMGLVKDFEWYGAFSLMVTLIWLYIEILRLLAKLNSRR